MDERPDITPLLASVVGNIVHLAGGDAGLVSVWDPDRGRLRATASYGIDRADQARLEAALSAILPRLDDADPVALDRALPHPATQRLLTVPLKSAGRLVGLLCLFAPDDRAASGEEPAVDVLSKHVEVVLQNARLLQRIIEEKRWLEAVIGATAEGILILGADGRIVGVNPSYTRLTGRSETETQGRTVADLFEVLSPSGWQGNGLIEVALRGDPRRVFEANRAIIGGEAGEPIGAVVSLRDVTARRDAEELQSTFFSVISHELKTPVAIIRGYADLLEEDVESLDPPELKRQLGIIREESDRLGRMVENLLEATRIQAGALDLRLEPLLIGTLVQRVVRRISRVTETHTVEAIVPDGLPVVLADAERLEEVLTNLIDNAIKYTPLNGRIDVRAATDARDVIVRVADEGSGVPVADRDRIFERFSRLDSRFIRKAKGAGLGLFICKAIVEAHGGRIWVESSAGGGAIFAFSIPRERPAELPAVVGFAGLLGHPEGA